MTPERLAELARRYGSLTPDAYAHDHPATHAAELLAEVKRLNEVYALVRTQRDGARRERTDEGARNADLRAEVKRLSERVQRTEQTIANSAEIITARDTQIRELEGNLSAVRGWARSRLHVLADRRREYPETPGQRGKTEVLDDLTRVLQHLDTTPAPAIATEGSDL